MTTTPIRKPVIYITNAELLAELNKCKATFCSYLDDRYVDFDVIINDKSDITDELVAELRAKKADRMEKATKKHLRTIKKPHQIKPHEWQVDPNSIRVEDLVFRVMTYEHIPAAAPEDLPKKIKTEADNHVKINFPAFKHYILEEGELREVGRSHWEGGIGNGWFSQDHGRITNKMGRMWMKLVERYGSKGNWRGYSYNDEMQAQALMSLTRFGLQFNEAKSSNPFAYYTVIAQNAFTGVLNKEKRSQGIRDDLLIMSGETPSMTRQLADEAKAKGEVPAPFIKGKPGRPKKT